MDDASPPHGLQERLSLPPLFEERETPEGVGVFDHACAVAAEAGAGALFWRDGPVLEIAVVLEPDEPLATARRAFLAGMTAIGDALASHCPPDREVAVRWPDELRFDGARIGGGRLAWAEGPETDPPAWLVFGAELIAARPGVAEAGRFPDSTSLTEEVFDPAPDIVESFARHLMLHVDAWRARGFRAVAERYLERLEGRARDLPRRIDALGDLIERETRRPLLPALRAPAWRSDKGPIL